MTNELIAQLAVLAIATLMTLGARSPHYTKYTFLSFMLVTMGLSVTVRTAGYDIDIEMYASQMRSPSLDVYYVKEPLFWIGSRGLFWLLGNDTYVFLVYDLITFGLVYLAFKNLSVPKYALYAFVCFFPFILGIQNVYRQWISAALLLYSLSLTMRGNTRWSIFTALLAPTAHNASAIFWTLLICHKRGLIANAAFASAIVLTPVVMIMGLDSKSSAETGANLSALYLVMLILFLAGYCALCGFTLRNNEITVAKQMVASIFIVVFGILLLSPAGAERLGMYALMLLYPLLALKIDTIKDLRVPLRLAFTHLGFWPIMLFGTAAFLQTELVR